MNDPNKCIDVNLSSLMSLKAELLRKQQEVNKAKNIRSSESFVPKKLLRNDKQTKMEQCFSSDEVRSYEHEDSALLEKSKKVLEAKSSFYNKMSAMGGQLNSDDNCLVLFNQKKQEAKGDTVRPVSSSSDEYSSDDNSHDGSDEEWTEFTDCLGRSRKCLKRDLETFKAKDKELAANMPEKLDTTVANWMIDTKGTESSMVTESLRDISDDMSMVSKHDEMRSNWEKKEEENSTKENIHYQDVFFDEARQHGVGYYAFSTDDEQRAKQQKALEEMRKKTLAEQAGKKAQRDERERIIAERVRSAKNRQRARLGLPPLEDEAEEDKSKEHPAETKEERHRRKREEKKQRKKEREEQRKERERKNYVRPWDKTKSVDSGEDGSAREDEAEWQYKAERAPMSQEQWNERKRAERNSDFAPVPEKIPRKERNFSEMAPPPVYSSNSSNFSAFQSSKSQVFQRKNYIGEGACIAPPSDLQYNFTRPQNLPQAHLEQSIEAGLRFLRNNADKGHLPGKSSWTSNADY